jgi:hypothetical protein
MLTTLSSHSNLEPYSLNWIEHHIVCEPCDDKCYFNECRKCSDGSRLTNTVLCNDAEMVDVKVTLWKKSRNERLNKTQFVKMETSQCVQSLYDVSNIESVVK